MLSKKSFLGRTAVTAAVAVATLVAVAAPLKPAMADKWKRHHGHYYYAYAPRFYSPRIIYRSYYAPPPVVYYQPQPVYVAPPPMVYEAPAPVYVAPSSLNFGITVPLR